MNALKFILILCIVYFTFTSCDDEKEAQPQPTITALSITEGEVGTNIIITGTNFGTVASDIEVTFNNTEASITTATTTTITTTVPTGATSGIVKVKVKSLEANGPSFTVLAPITVSVSAFTKMMQENPVGIEGPISLGNITATTNRGTLTYSLSSQTPEGAITLNTSTGQLFVANAAAFDFEVNPSIIGAVTVANGEEIATANITITITNVEEVTINNLAFSIAENPDAENLGIGSVTCCWIEGSPSFVINSQNPEGAVAINAGNGQFTVANIDAFDFETNPTITGTYSVISQSETKTANFTISLTDVVEIIENVIPTTYSVFSGAESVADCTDGSGSNIRFTNPHFGYTYVPDGYPWSLFVSDLTCGVKRIDVNADGSQTSTTVFTNSAPQTWEYTDMVYSADGSYLLMVYRGSNNGNGNVLSHTIVNVDGNGGTLTNNFSNVTLINPEGLARDADGKIWVTEPRTIKKFNVATFGLGTLQATYGDASIAESIDGTLSEARFLRIRDVQAATDGIIYVADQNAVRKINEATNTVSTVASGFDNPRAIGVLPNGNIIVADTGNGKVRLIDVSTGEKSTLIENLGDYPPSGIMVQTNDVFYFTRAGLSAVYKANISYGCAQCR
ncbi:hypothetical protein SanaruYs_24310 [Chryseotalea sanaruensis]|uniref:IPT/TIG domain-containing protein n=1 Tax=Chryseotalea sanaruensis TaxID=2482724 RepID=A0A401UBD4_9BACT|nr:IPT/TIG domain-containing protein [Chryseotalea sanaruensis]GCC52195.1 hypothetical protein SanaruYs_24310 [Chryseotalea sanaruensis]